MKLRFAHGAFEPQQEPVVEQAGMIDAIGVGNQSVGHSILLSEAFAQAYEGRLTLLGDHCLRAVTDKQKIFTLPSFQEETG